MEINAQALFSFLLIQLTPFQLGANFKAVFNGSVQTVSYLELKHPFYQLEMAQKKEILKKIHSNKQFKHLYRNNIQLNTKIEFVNVKLRENTVRP